MTAAIDDYLALPFREALDAFSRHYLSVQVRRFDGNVSRTALEIGMDRKNLTHKLRDLGLWSIVAEARADAILSAELQAEVEAMAKAEAKVRDEAERLARWREVWAAKRAERQAGKCKLTPADRALGRALIRELRA